MATARVGVALQDGLTCHPGCRVFLPSREGHIHMSYEGGGSRIWCWGHGQWGRQGRGEGHELGSCRFLPGQLRLELLLPLGRKVNILWRYSIQSEGFWVFVPSRYRGSGLIPEMEALISQTTGPTPGSAGGGATGPRGMLFDLFWAGPQTWSLPFAVLSAL